MCFRRNIEFKIDPKARLFYTKQICVNQLNFKIKHFFVNNENIFLLDVILNL